MTGFEIKRFDFNAHEVLDETEKDERLSDWPVVYTIDNERFIYVGESQHVDKRMAQHLKDSKKSRLRRIRVVVDERFNRSVSPRPGVHAHPVALRRREEEVQAVERQCRHARNANYYRRDEYRATFREIFDQLQAEGMFQELHRGRSKTATSSSSPLTRL